jgi:hypothetical protein
MTPEVQVSSCRTLSSCTVALPENCEAAAPSNDCTYIRCFGDTTADILVSEGTQGAAGVNTSASATARFIACSFSSCWFASACKHNCV